MYTFSGRREKPIGAIGSRETQGQHTTVLRRISQLAGRSGARLFEKKPAGYQLTESGNSLLEQWCAAALRRSPN